MHTLAVVTPLSWIFKAGDGTFGTIAIDPIGDTLDAVRIEIHDQTVPFIAAADVYAGVVKRVEYRAKDGQRITQRLIRSTNLIGFFERWGLLAEHASRASELGDYQLLGMFAEESSKRRPAEELLESLEGILAEQRTRAGRKRLRGQEAHDLMVRVVEEYKQAVEAGDPSPRTTIAGRLGYSSEHIGRLLVRARRTDPPLLGPARRGRAGEDEQ